MREAISVKRLFSIVWVIVGIILTLLGVLWFLQGAGLVVIEPILCVTDCEPMTGPSTQWQVMGAAAFLAGGLLAGFFGRRLFR